MLACSFMMCYLITVPTTPKIFPDSTGIILESRRQMDPKTEPSKSFSSFPNKNDLYTDYLATKKMFFPRTFSFFISCFGTESLSLQAFLALSASISAWLSLLSIWSTHSRNESMVGLRLWYEFKPMWRSLPRFMMLLLR